MPPLTKAMAIPPAKRKTGTGVHRTLTAMKKDVLLYVLAFPGIAFFIVFKYLPMWGIVISFQDYSPYLGLLHSKWVGFEHFNRFFSNPDFWLLFRNTLAINLINLAFFFPLPILLSLLLNELRNEKYKKLIQSVVYLPHFLSWVIIAGLCFLLLGSDGVVNKLFLHFGWSKFDFLTNPHIFWGLLTGQSIWKETGWGTVIFLAAIAGTDPQLYEAAKIDGAGRARQAWHVTLPSIRNIIVVLLILRLGQIMDVGFEQIFLMRNSAVSDMSEVYDTYAYRLGIQQGQFSFSTAVGLFKSLVGLILVIIANRISKKFGEEGVY